LSELAEKDINELISEGNKKLSSVPSGGGGGGGATTTATGGGGGAPAPETKQEEEKKEEKEEVSRHESVLIVNVRLIKFLLSRMRIWVSVSLIKPSQLSIHISPCHECFMQTFNIVYFSSRISLPLT
jgi:hypothetical protein